MSKIIALVGPTGVGKTKISILLAKHLNAEIINADSVSIYKEADIGSAKVTKEEMMGIKHHLLDFVDPSSEYTIYNFQKDGRQVLDELIKQNKNIIITGGSGLYLKALLYDYSLNKEESKENNLFENLTNEELKQKVDSIYKDNQIHINNRQRLIRFLNSYSNTGNIIKQENKNKKVYDFITVGITLDRETLYNRINLRVDKMIEDGLIEEAKYLYDKQAKIFPSIIGYKEFIPYFENKMALDETINLIKQHTRNYAKRQYTWFNNQMEVRWYTVNLNDVEETVNEIIKKESLDF